MSENRDPNLDTLLDLDGQGHRQSVAIDVDALRDSRQINDVIQALRGMDQRAGVRVR